MARKEFTVCPNCGRRIQGPEYLMTVAKIPNQVGIDFDPIAGRFLCPDCDYSGLPIQVKEEDYSKMEFENKKIEAPLERSNPMYFKLAILFVALLVMIMIFLSGLGAFSYLLILAVLFFGFYVALKVPKYRKSQSS